jgi:hypothetical protein
MFSTHSYTLYVDLSAPAYSSRSGNCTPGTCEIRECILDLIQRSPELVWHGGATDGRDEEDEQKGSCGYVLPSRLDEAIYSTELLQKMESNRILADI